MDPHTETPIEDIPDVRLPICEAEPASAPGESTPKPYNWLLDSSDTLSAITFTWILSIVVAACTLCMYNPNHILRSKLQFQTWFPQYSYQFNIIAGENCSSNYSTYLYGTKQNTTTPTLSGAGSFTMFVQPMIDCLLGHSSEYIKYQFASSQVLLGITPTVICLIGATSEEVCFCALIGRRRLLGILLSAASPSIYTERAFKYQDADQILKDLNDNHVKTTVITRPRWLFVVMEYVVVLAAIANAAVLNWQLGLMTVNTLNANIIYMPLLWSCLGICAHLLGAVVFGMRTRRLHGTAMETRPRTTIRSCLKALRRLPKVSGTAESLASIVRTELFWLPEERNQESNTNHPTAKEDDEARKRIYFTLLPETRCFTFLSWLFSVVVIFHLVIGTLMLSSTNFIGPRDALSVMARYILSVVVCRIVLVYELAVLNMEYKPQAQSVDQTKKD